MFYIKKAGFEKKRAFKNIDTYNRMLLSLRGNTKF
jgi:hypothetical protein